MNGTSNVWFRIYFSEVNLNCQKYLRRLLCLCRVLDGILRERRCRQPSTKSGNRKWKLCLNKKLKRFAKAFKLLKISKILKLSDHRRESQSFRRECQTVSILSKLVNIFQRFPNPPFNLKVSFRFVCCLSAYQHEKAPQVNLPLGSPQVVTKMLSGVKVKCVRRGEVKLVSGWGTDWKGSYCERRKGS